MQTESYLVGDVYSLWSMSIDCEISLWLYLSSMGLYICWGSV